MMQCVHKQFLESTARLNQIISQFFKTTSFSFWEKLYGKESMEKLIMRNDFPLTALGSRIIG